MPSVKSYERGSLILVGEVGHESLSRATAVDVPEHELVEKIAALTTRTGEIRDRRVEDIEPGQLFLPGCPDEQPSLVRPELRVTREEAREHLQEGDAHMHGTFRKGDTPDTPTLIDDFEEGAEILPHDARSYPFQGDIQRSSEITPFTALAWAETVMQEAENLGDG